MGTCQSELLQDCERGQGTAPAPLGAADAWQCSGSFGAAGLGWPAWLTSPGRCPMKSQGPEAKPCPPTLMLPPLSPRFSAAKSAMRRAPGVIHGKLSCSSAHSVACCCPSHSDVHLGMADLANKNRRCPVKIGCQTHNTFFLGLSMSHALCGICVY